MGRLPTFCFSGAGFTPKAEEITRLRHAAERVARTHGLDVFDVQLRREPIGIVLLGNITLAYGPAFAVGCGFQVAPWSIDETRIASIKRATSGFGNSPVKIK